MRRATLIPFVLSLCLGAAAVEAANPWIPIGPYGGQIRGLEADPRHAGVLYAGTRSGVFKSTDGGTTWLRSSRGLKRGFINDLAVAPTDSSVVYAAGLGVFVSRDGGATWSGPTLGDLYVTSIDVDPRNPRRVWVGTYGGVYRSDNGGATWTRADSDLVAIGIDVVVDPFDSDIVYAVVSPMEGYGIEGVVKSTDAGATWVELAGGLDTFFSEDYAQLAVDPTTPGLLYVSFRVYSDNPVATWRSTDRGATWQRTEGGFPLAVDRRGAVYSGDMRSTDHGQTWQKGAMPPDLTVRYAASAAGDGTLWAGTHRLGVFGSRDRAATWRLERNGLHATSVASFAIDPEQPRVIYAGAGTAGVQKLLRTGAGWQRTDAGLPSNLYDFTEYQALAVDPLSPRTVYLGWSEGIARSDDGGAHWNLLRVEGGGRMGVLAIAADPTVPGRVFVIGTGVGASGEHCALARSEDRGVTFQCVPPFDQDRAFRLTQMVFDPHKPEIVWLTAGEEGLWKSTDHGTHWKAVRPRGLENAGSLYSLAFDPIHPGRMFLSTGHVHGGRRERVWRSDDGGLSWRPWGRGFPETSFVGQLLVDLQKPNILYATVVHSSDPEDNASGVYWSRDGGRTFRPAGLTGSVLELSQDPKNPRKLYASLVSRGIYSWIRP